MSDLRIELIQGQLNDIEENVRSIKSTWGNTIMTLDNIKSSLKGDRQKAIDEAYQKGLDDAWKAITKIAKMPDGEREKVFGDWWISNILNKFSTSEIINILDGYEHEQDEIKVGDEVTPKSNNSNWLGVVVRVDDTNAMVMTRDGYTAMYRLEILKNTGKHFPQMAELLRGMKEGAE